MFANVFGKGRSKGNRKCGTFICVCVCVEEIAISNVSYRAFFFLHMHS